MAVGVTVRGVRYRAGRSLVVFALAVVATAAVVLVPAYTLAAERSALTDQLRARPPAELGLTFTGTDPDRVAAVASRLLRRAPRLAAVTGHRWSGGAGRVTVASVAGTPRATVLHRSGLCRRLRLVAGHCPSDPGLLVEAGTARRYGLSVGDAVRFAAADDDPAGTPAGAYRHRIAGVYRLPDTGSAYWWGGGRFGTAGAEPLLSTDPGVLAAPGLSDRSAEVDVEVLPDRVRPADAAALRSATSAAVPAVAADGDVALRTRLPAALAAAAADRAAILSSVPVVVVPLVLLCWFVLYLAVAAVTEERGPEIALAALRGFGTAGAARFGLAETVLVIVAATPVGLLAGLGGTELLALLVLAPGTHVALSVPILAAVGVAVLGAVGAAAVAARRTVRAAPLALLRRVPARGRWRANLVEGAAAALAAAALYQVLSDPRSALGLLAPPLLALVVGLAVARLIALLAGRGREESSAGRRHGGGARRTRPYRLLAAAQLARRPLAQRLVLAVTVAVSVLTFAVLATDVAAHDRDGYARETVGASAVYTVRAASARQLVDAVRRVDPDGTAAMAVMQTRVHYGDGALTVLAVDSARLPATATWPGRDAAALRGLAARLPGTAAAPLRVRGALAATVRAEQPPAGLSLTARIVDADGTVRAVRLGTVRAGRHAYRAALPGCGGCRLAGLGLTRTGGDGGTARLAVTGLADAGGALPAGLGAPGRWRVTDGAGARLSTSDGLVLDWDGGPDSGVVLGDASVPRRLPAVLAGPAPADDPHADRFEFPALGGTPLPFTVLDRDRRIPRAGTPAVLTDLDALQRLLAVSPDAVSATVPGYQVWAAPDAGADLPARLAAAGVPVTRTDTLAAASDRLSRQAPGLALRLYLVAGVAAVLLALGAVALSGYTGARARRYETAALAVAGVPAGQLRRAVRTEYRVLLGVPLVAGLLAGGAGAVLLLPVLPLVTATDAGVHRGDQLGPYWLPGAVAVTVVAMGAVAALTARLLGRIEPALVREGTR